MSWLTHFLKSTIGSKWLMAITGAGWVLFLIAHMLANLQVFAGPDAINGYAAGLREMPPVLWGARSLLLLGILFHVALAIKLAGRNRGARPVGYVKKKNLRSSAAGRTMILSGLVFGFFLAYHIAHYTLLVVHPEYQDMVDPLGRHDVYTMVIAGFSNKLVAGLYIGFVALVAMHLYHGVPSLFQTLGLRHPKYTPALRGAGVGLALVLFLGFAAVPVGVMAGWVEPIGGMLP